MTTYIDKILNELSYRVSNGTPNFTNEQHMIKLSDVLKELDWSIEGRVELIKNLLFQIFIIDEYIRRI